MRTLHIINGLGTGGAERSLAELLPHLPDRGIDPVIVCLYARDEGVQQSIIESGAEVHLLQSRRPVARARELRGTMRRYAMDVVHTTLFDSDILGRISAAGSVPVVTSLVNTSYDRSRYRDPAISPWRLRATQLIDAMTAHLLTAHFHAITEAVKSAAVRDLGLRPERITVVPRGRSSGCLGEPSTARRRAARQRLGFGADTVLLLNVARQEYQKGQRVLLDAAARLASPRPEVVWLLAGRDGNVSEELRAQRTRLGLEERVRFLGHRDDVPELLAAADAFVFPSLYEGLGGALIEAMALGTPVIASDLPVIREVTDSGHAGLLVPPADPDALAQGVVRVLSDHDARERLSTAGQRRYAENYTIEMMVDGMASLFHAVAEQGRSLRTP